MSSKEYIKRLVKEEVAPFKKMLGETHVINTHNHLSAHKADKIKYDTSIKGKEPSGLPTIKSDSERKDFTRWVMEKFGKNIPKDLSPEEVQKILFSANEDKIKTLNLSAHPSSLGKLYVTKMQLNRSLSSDKMNKTLAAYDAAYAEEESKSKEKKNLSANDTGGESFETAAPHINQNSKQRAEQIFKDAKAKMMGRAMIGNGSLKEMNRVVLQVANQAADLYVKLLVGAVKIAIEDRSVVKDEDRDFSAVDFVEGLNSQVLKRKPDYAVEEDDISNEELAAIQYFGDEFEKLLKLRKPDLIANKQAEVIDMLMDDFGSGEGDGQFLQYFAAVIQEPAKEELAQKVGSGASRVNAEQVANLQKQIDSLETERDATASETKKQELDAKIKVLAQQIETLKIDPEHKNFQKRLSALATEYADLESELLVYDASSPGKHRQAQDKIKEITSRMEAIEAEMSKIREMENERIPDANKRLKMTYSGGNVMKTFQHLVAKMMDSYVNEELTDAEKEKIQNSLSRGSDSLDLGVIDAHD